MKQLCSRGVLFALLLAGLGSLTVWVEQAKAQILQGSITGNVTDASQAAGAEGMAGRIVVAGRGRSRDGTRIDAASVCSPSMTPINRSWKS